MYNITHGKLIAQNRVGMFSMKRNKLEEFQDPIRFHIKPP